MALPFSGVKCQFHILATHFQSSIILQKKRKEEKCTNEVVLFAVEVLDLCGDIDRRACHIWQRAVSTH